MASTLRKQAGRLQAMTVLGVMVLLPATVPFAANRADSSDSAAVRSVWQSVDAMWNARDAEQFSLLYAEDASFEFVGRERILDGRAAIREHFTERFANYAPDLRHLTTIRDVSTIAHGVQAVDGTVKILRVVSGGSEGHEVLKTFAIFAVMTRNADALQIRALRIYEMPAAANDP